MAWIQVDDGIREHDKIYNLADTLGISNAHAVGLMVCFWTWAVTAAPDGDVTNFPPRAIMKAAGWDKSGQKSAQQFYDSLISTRFLEQTSDGKVLIRNWEQRATLLIDYIEKQKKKTRDRVQKFRERKKKDQSVTVTQECNDDVTLRNGACNVTETLSNGTTVPIPKSKVPNQSKLSDNNNPLPSTEEGDMARDFSEVGKLFSERVKPMPSSGDSDKLQQLLGQYGSKKLQEAILEAERGRGHSVAYVQRILEGWERDSTAPPPVSKAAGPDLTDTDRYKNFGG